MRTISKHTHQAFKRFESLLRQYIHVENSITKHDSCTACVCDCVNTAELLLTIPITWGYNLSTWCRQCKLHLPNMPHYLSSSRGGMASSWQPQQFYLLHYMSLKLSKESNQKWQSRPFLAQTDRENAYAPPWVWDVSKKDSCSVLLSYQFQQVGRRTALLSQGLFQQSLPVLVLLTHTWVESYTQIQWLFY